MALTTVKADGLTADLIDETKLADNSLDSEHYNDGSIDHAHLANDCIDGDNIQDDVINSEHIAAGAVDLEHMSSESVDEDNLHISNAGSNGQFLSKQSGNAGGLTWATVSGTPEGTAILSTGETGGTKFLREDGDNSCSWQTVSAGAGGATALSLNDGVKVNFGSDDDLRISGGSGNSVIQHQDTAAGDLFIDAENSNIYLRSGDGSTGEENAIVCENNGKVKLYHSGTHVAETSANGLALPDGKGIDFSADANNAGMDNELLDDYEEGYFTFTMDSESGDAWTSRSGYTKMRYVKIGNQVTISGKYETNSSSGTPSGRLQITGLPFASISATSDANNTRSFPSYIRGMNSDDHIVGLFWWMGSNYTSLLAHSFSNDNDGDFQSFGTAQLAVTTVWQGDVTFTYFTS